MLKRIVKLLAVAAMVVVMFVPAGPASAQANVSKYGNCHTGLGTIGERCTSVNTPSGQQIVHVEDNPQEPGPATGEGATQPEPLCGDFLKAHGVVTPSGNVNVQCVPNPSSF